MNACPPRHKRIPKLDLNPLEATLTTLAVTIVNKGLTEAVSPLDAMLTKYQGGVS
jgi:hypothetical protein